MIGDNSVVALLCKLNQPHLEKKRGKEKVKSGKEGEKFAGTIQSLQKDGLSVLLAESDVKRLGFAETIYTIERGEIVPA